MHNTRRDHFRRLLVFPLLSVFGNRGGGGLMKFASGSLIRVDPDPGDFLRGLERYPATKIGNYEFSSGTTPAPVCFIKQESEITITGGHHPGSFFVVFSDINGVRFEESPPNL
jgi:hypothetical protein